MHRTPWSKQNSSLPSDRIKPSPKPPPPNNTSTKSKGKGKQQQPEEPPKSKEVRRLEDLLQRVQTSTGGEKDPKGGCFCLARTHDLSTYTPICHKCGLILCSTNQPYHSCPHCGRNLLAAGGVRETLIIQIEDQLAATIAKELDEKERAIAQAQREAGAFPQLKPGPSITPPRLHSPSPSPAPSTRQTHKVMSLTGGGTGNNRRVLVSSYTTTPVASRPASRSGEEIPDEEPTRVPPPLPRTSRRPGKEPSASRPYENMLGWAVSYVPPSRVDDVGNATGASSRRKRGNNRGKGKEKENVSGGTNAGP